MPLARRFTRRLARHDSSAAPSRSPSVRKEISLPINLLSSTSALSYDAPDLADARKVMLAAASGTAPPSPTMPDLSCSSSDTECAPDSPTAPSLTDASSLESSPALEYNHLSIYFPNQPKSNGMLSHEAPPPAIPRRVPSHSKKEHERLARKRSLQSSNTTLRCVASPVDSQHPPPATHLPATLSSGMDQVLENVEEEAEQDAAYMRDHGLRKLTAEDYCAEIGSLLWPASPFNAGLPPTDTNSWI